MSSKPCSHLSPPQAATLVTFLKSSGPGRLCPVQEIGVPGSSAKSKGDAHARGARQHEPKT
eukprot:4751695-Amphidinium_carterae.1